MKLSHIPGAIIQRLRPSVIRSTDDLSTALERKKKDTLTFQSVEKLLCIANVAVTGGTNLRLVPHFQEVSHLEDGGDTAFCTRAADMPLRTAPFAIEALRNAAKDHLSVGARLSLNHHLTTLLNEVEDTQSRWTDLYWENYNPALAAKDQNGISGRAAKCLGVAPDPSTQKKDLPSDTRMLDIFKRMAGSQEAKLPPKALDVLEAAFVRLHGVPSLEDPALYGREPCMVYSRHEEKDFIKFPDTQRTLQDLRQWVGAVDKAGIKDQLIAKLDRFDASVKAGVNYCLGARQALLDAGTDDQKALKELEKFNAWLGDLKDADAQRIDIDSAAQVPEQPVMPEQAMPAEGKAISENSLYTAVASLFQSNRLSVVSHGEFTLLEEMFEKSYGVTRNEAMNKNGRSGNGAGESLNASERAAVLEDLDKIMDWLESFIDKSRRRDDVVSWLYRTYEAIENAPNATAAEPTDLQQPQVLKRSDSLSSFSSRSSAGSEPPASSGRDGQNRRVSGNEAGRPELESSNVHAFIHFPDAAGESSV